MSGADDTPLGPAPQWVTCPKCGERYLSIYARCPTCTLQLKAEEIVIDTHNIKRKPTTSPGPAQRQDVLEQNGNIVLQFLPSGLCVMLSLAQPTVLGRRTGDLALDGYDLVDLTTFGGYRHGVSRAHCVLERQGSALMVTDLGSRNGTYLNDLRLIPHRPQQVVHNDRLILGTLHTVVAFSVVEPGNIQPKI